MQPLILGLTGGVASGKSTCARWLAGADGVVLDADEVAREVQNDPEMIGKMEAILGVPLRSPSGGLDRAAAARAAFGDPERLGALENALHPEIRRRLEARLDAARASAATSGVPRIVVLDAPLLFEAGLAEKCDRIVFVESEESSRAARARDTRGWEASEVARREAHQLDLPSKRLRSHHVVRNTGTLEELAAACAALRAEILAAPPTRA